MERYVVSEAEASRPKPPPKSKGSSIAWAEPAGKRIAEPAAGSASTSRGDGRAEAPPSLDDDGFDFELQEGESAISARATSRQEESPSDLLASVEEAAKRSRGQASSQAGPATPPAAAPFAFEGEGFNEVGGHAGRMGTHAFTRAHA
jgi:hypothetical protein